MFSLVQSTLMLATLVNSMPSLRAYSARDTNSLLIANVSGPSSEAKNAGVPFLNDPTSNDSNLYNNTTPNGGGSFSLVFDYGGTTINITMETCLLHSSKPLGIWTTLNNVTDETADILELQLDALRGRNTYGSYAQAMATSIKNNCADGLEEIDQWLTNNVCYNSTPVDIPSDLDPGPNYHNELRRLLMDELPEISPRTVTSTGSNTSPGRPNGPLINAGDITYFGYLLTASAVTGVVVGTVTNAVFPNNTFAQNFVAGIFPAAVVLLSGTINYINQAPLRRDIGLLMAAAAAAKMRAQARRAIAGAGATATNLISQGTTGQTDDGINIVQGATQSGGQASASLPHCASSNSLVNAFDSMCDITSQDLQLASFEVAMQVLESGDGVLSSQSQC